MSTDYANLMNQQRLANTNSLFGNSNNNSIAGISGDALQQWAMLGANSSAYKKLLEAEKNGSIKQSQSHVLNSDKYFNDHYDPKTNKITKATYTPQSQSGAQVDADATTGDQLSDMRTLALAAISNPDKLSSTHYDLFEKMRQNLASNLVTKGGSSSGDATAGEEAKAASVSKTIDYRLLLEDQSIVVAGNKGEQTYNFGTGSSLEDVVSKINADTAATGVKAELVEADGGKYELKFTSAETGKDQFVRLDQKTGSLFAAAGSSLSGKGTDAVKEEGKTVVTSDDTQAAMVAGTPYGKLFEDNAFTVQGAKGSYSFSFAKGTDAADIAAAINDQAEKTGVKAEAIYNADGTVAGIGLLADKAGAGNYVQVKQDKGELFANEGRTASVAGSSTNSSAGKGGTDSGPSITNLSDLGKVSLNGQVYSFADLGPGGKASLSKNPDAALAVIDKAIRDIAEGRAQVKGFEASEMYTPGVTNAKDNNTGSGANASTNTREHNNYNSSDLTNWLNKYVSTKS